MRTAWGLGLLVVVTGWSTTGCEHFMPPSKDKGAATEPSPTSCSQLAMIDDGEDDDQQALAREGRGGYWYVFADKGSEIKPGPSAFRLAKGGPGDSQRAFRMRGQIGTGQDVYAGLGLSFVEPKGPYDGARYRGIAFAAKRSPDSTAAIRFKVPDANTEPGGGVCQECYNDFGIDFQIAEHWTRYVVDFADLKQEQGWGTPRPPAVDASKLFGLQWQVATPGAKFDIWLDDISFVGCP